STIDEVITPYRLRCVGHVLLCQLHDFVEEIFSHSHVTGGNQPVEVKPGEKVQRPLTANCAALQSVKGLVDQTVVLQRFRLHRGQSRKQSWTNRIVVPNRNMIQSDRTNAGFQRARWIKWLEREFTNRKVRGSNPTSASQLHLSRLGQPGSIRAHVLLSGVMAARTGREKLVGFKCEECGKCCKLKAGFVAHHRVHDNERLVKAGPSQTETDKFVLHGSKSCFHALAMWTPNATMICVRSTRAEILPGCPSLYRGSREAKVGFEPQTFRSVDSRSNHLSDLARIYSVSREFWFLKRNQCRRVARLSDIDGYPYNM
ncbi:hypothetical protein CSKR_106366, partial [Clonorchis sinensis]